CYAVDAFVIRPIVDAIPVCEDTVAVSVAERAVPLTYVRRFLSQKGKHTNRRAAVQRTRALVVKVYAHDAAMSHGALLGRFKCFRYNLPARMKMNGPRFWQILGRKWCAN